jgi:thiol-disulfide isomerase/thioredoxin
LAAPSSLAAEALPGGIYFQIGDFHSIKARAAEADKLLFVHFTASWCMPCQWMENNTFQNSELGAFVNEHYLSVKVDIDARQGLRLKEEYQIVALPTMLVLDPRGLVVGRYEESMDAARLHQLLRRHYFEVEDLAAPVAKVDAAGGRPPAGVFRPALIPEAAAAENPPPRYESETSFGSDSPAKVRLTPKDRYGIQVGVFGTYQNAVRQLEQYQERFRQPVWIFPGTHEGRQIFRIVIGSFEDSAAASDFAGQLQQQSIQGIVKELSNL